MKFAVAVHEAPHASQAADSAVRFIDAALSAGHEVERVFFYHDGVRAAHAGQVAPQDEQDLMPRWRQFHAAGIELAVCVAASLKRGLVNDAERERYGLDAVTLEPCFTIVGLGQLIEAVCSADRFIEFAG